MLMQPPFLLFLHSMATFIGSVLLKNSFNRLLQRNTINRAFHLTSLLDMKVGDKVPSVELLEANPGNPVNLAEFCKNKKVVMFGVPGAFTPGCSKTHLPGFVERYNELKKKGVDEIICLSVNDVFVLEAWAKEQDAIGKIRMFADPSGNFVKMAGLDIDIPKLGGIRSKRFSMIIENGVVTFLSIEPDGTGLSCSLATKLPL